MRALTISAAFAVFAVSVQGCGESSRNPHRGVEVTYSADLTADQRKVYAADVAAVVSAWQADHQVRLAPITIEVTTDLAQCQSKLANGCALLEERRVLVYAQDRLWQLYHELCHVGLQLEDHSDPRWSTWDLRGAEVLR